MAENKPQIPTLKESQNEKKGGAPALKIKGLQSGLSLIERLKQFKKKDLAFILAGLGVLFMAPLAEHFMMSPESGQGSDQMSPGFGGGKGGPFGGGAPNVYDGGLNGLAPGGAAGSGSDVITPLNVRDPSALVMGPNATQQPPATASAPATPPPPPPSKEDSKWNDAIAAGKAAASSAVKKAALPVPKVPLSAGGLRGLGAVSGGSGSSFSLAPISSNGLASGKVNQSNGLTGTNGSGFKGVARGPGSGGNSGRLEDLKNKAAAQAGDMNRTGSASSALEAAANRDMSGGSGGGGAGEGGSHDDKATSGSQSKDSKSPGESLDFLRQKMQMEKDIAFADELRKSAPCPPTAMLTAGFGGAGNLKCNEIANDVEKSLLEDGIVKPLSSWMGDTLKGLLSPSKNAVLSCVDSSNPSSPAPVQIGAGKWTDCYGGSGAAGNNGSSLNNMQACVDPNGVGYWVSNGTMGNKIGACSSKGSGTPSDGSDPSISPNGGGIPGGAVDLSKASISDYCKSANGFFNTDAAKATGKASVVTTGGMQKLTDAATKLKGVGGDMGALEITIAGRNSDAQDCGPAVSQNLPQSKPSDLGSRIKDMRQRLRKVASDLRFKVIKNDNATAGTEDGKLWATYKTGNDKVNQFFSSNGLPLAGDDGKPTQVGTPDMSSVAGDKFLYSKDEVKKAQGDFNSSFQSLVDEANKPDSGIQTAAKTLAPYANGQAPELNGAQKELTDLYQTIDASASALRKVQSDAGQAVAGLDPKDQGSATLQQGADGIKRAAASWIQQVNHLNYEQGQLQHAYDALTATVKPDGLVGKAHNEAMAAVTFPTNGQPAQGITSATPQDKPQTYQGKINSAFNALSTAAPETKPDPTDQQAKVAAQTKNQPVMTQQATPVQGVQQAMATTKNQLMTDLQAAGSQVGAQGPIETKLWDDGAGPIKDGETWTPGTPAPTPTATAPAGTDNSQSSGGGARTDL